MGQTGPNAGQRNRYMDWTDETIARLRELWSQGLSTAEIGRQLSITKNAVVGKAHRLGLPPRPSPIRNRKVKDGETPSTETPRRKPPTRKPAAPKAEASADLLAEKTEAKPAAAKTDAPKPAPAKPSPALESIMASPPPRPVAAKVDSPARVAPVAPEPRVPPPVRPAPPPRFTASIDRPARRGPSCCWPIGDPGTPGFHFCGATPLPGKPYCAEHAAIAYVKIRDRRD
ncbi:GcrA cell cycle regulator [Gluconobacter thailandicus]|uniref:GcrA cell cycle regulator n=2 Tax=Gluconobacter thailandicus TaxID=257438 RepID=A0AAP9ERS4_GLUTH|nr:GcrA cell cycle regulator [Gluconobacter thailandicus]